VWNDGHCGIPVERRNPNLPFPKLHKSSLVLLVILALAGSLWLLRRQNYGLLPRTTRKGWLVYKMLLISQHLQVAQIFQRVEEESERRAQQETITTRIESTDNESKPGTNLKTKEWRRGSISISRLGQVSRKYHHICRMKVDSWSAPRKLDRESSRRTTYSEATIYQRL